MCAEFEGRATFVVVYLEEAHPTDGWMFEAVVHQVTQHTSSEERHRAAKVLQGELDTAIAAAQLGAPAAVTVRTPNILVDSMANLASTTFGAFANARAIATRCCSPPESADGLWLMRSARPSMASNSCPRDFASPLESPAIVCGTITFSSAVNSGSR